MSGRPQLPGAAHLYRSTVGKKIAMALTGVILVLWVIGHMLGNLKAFLGPAATNQHGEGLRTVGEPFFPRSSVLWVVRIAILVSAGVHILAAAQLTLQSRAARAVAYRKTPHLELPYASRKMRW